MKLEQFTEPQHLGVNPVVTSRERSHRARSLVGYYLGWSAVATLLLAATASAQELEPRAFSPSPIGTNFAAAAFSHLSGDVSLDPSVPITNVKANINIYSLGYAHTFALLGRSASVGLAVPYFRAGVSGNVEEVGPTERDLTGTGDIRMRFAMLLIGGPALTPKEFAHRTRSTIVGVNLKVVAPTGQYDSSKLINIGQNRWAFKPEIGLSQPIGNWFTDAIGGVWVHTDNTNYFGGKTRSQDPLWTFQVDGGYEFRPGLWFSANATYYTGGNTTVNGVRNQDRLQSTRYGFTISAPLSSSWSTKFDWSKGLTARTGGEFEEFTFALQYRWFTRH
ncbi:MAG TPA: transporter [Burkholderiales bacterium]|nr:transporter [Burkholderiales bacterium]